LLRADRRPRQAYAALIQEAGSALTILEAEHGLLAAQLLDAAREDVARWGADGIQLLTALDPEYPANLRAVEDRPALIFISGSYQARDTRSVAVIGTRRPSSAGLARARAITEQLVERGYTVASGLAAGIDTEVHRSALAAGGRTIAVIGTGLQIAYPPENAPLQRRIAADCAVVSQFMPEARPSRSSFPARNGVMAGLTLATIIVEASATSGARVQARLGLEQGRPVFLARSLLEQGWATELAARPGVYVLGSAAELNALLERHASPDVFAA
jgi:DNA processing protein